MPRSFKDIMKHAEELSRHIEEDFQPAETPEEAELKAAAFRRAQAEADVASAVVAAVEAGQTWATIGAALGTSGEAARQRYSKLCKVHGGMKVKSGATGQPQG